MPDASLIDRYTRQALALLPPGRALSRSAGSIVRALLEGVSVELARVHERAADMLREAVPSTTSELLPEWESATGLPDCTSPETIEGRQAALVSKLTASGGQSDETFESIAEAMGAEVTLAHQYLPFQCTDPCTEETAGIEWGFTKHVTYSVLPDQGTTTELECRMEDHAHLYGVLTFEELLLGTRGGDTIVTRGGDTIEVR